MSKVEISLGAALRDVSAARPEARAVAVRSLSRALLDEQGLRAPVWWASVEHPKRGEVLGALERAAGLLDSPDTAQDAALACIGLAELGAPSALERARAALDNTLADDAADPGASDAAIFARECGVIALALIAHGAQAWLEQPASTRSAHGDESERARASVETIRAQLLELLQDPRDDVRFQACPALAELGGDDVEARLAATLDAEQHPEVRENLIAALSTFDPPSPATCERLGVILASEEGQGPVGWEAAVALAAARRPEASPRLVRALADRFTRDRALEALAVIAPALDTEARAEAREGIDRCSRPFLIPIFTRVRAAYALARLDPPAGEAKLDQLRRHLRPAVREAVDEARVNLQTLAEREQQPAGEGYRRAASPPEAVRSPDTT